MKRIISIKKICVLSSYACSVFSFLHGWIDPVGNLLMGVAELTPTQRESCQKEFAHSVECAIERMRSEPPIKAHRDIFEELIDEKFQVSNLKELISKTEKCQSQYYTEKDIRDLIKTFEGYLKEEIARSEYLTHFISLQFYENNIKKMEAIYNVTATSNEQIDRIKIVINDSFDILKESYSKIETSNEILVLVRKILNAIFGAATFTLVAMFAYFLISIFAFQGLEPIFVVVAPISYFVSNLLLLSSKRNKIMKSFTRLIRVPLKVHGIRLSSCFFQMIIAVSLFVTIMCASNTHIINIVNPAIAVALGSIAGTFAMRWF